jgi:hypothetical protein
MFKVAYEAVEKWMRTIAKPAVLGSDIVCPAESYGTARKRASGHMPRAWASR